MHGNNYLRILHSSVSKSIRNRIPADTRVWNTALTYLESGITNSDGFALWKFQPGIINEHLYMYKKKTIACTRVWQLPWIVKYCKTAVCSSSMSCCSKQPYMHAVTWQNWWWHHSLRTISTPDSQQKLILFIPKDNAQTHILYIRRKGERFPSQSLCITEEPKQTKQTR